MFYSQMTGNYIVSNAFSLFFISYSKFTKPLPNVSAQQKGDPWPNPTSEHRREAQHQYY